MSAEETNCFGGRHSVQGEPNASNTKKMPAEQAFISIRNLGPVSKCDLVVDKFTVLTGRQAAGKSTVAKCIYFCRTIKDDLFSVIMEYKNIPTIRQGAELEGGLLELVKFIICDKFLQLFGLSVIGGGQMSVEYQYSADTWLKISHKDSGDPMHIDMDLINLDFSENIVQFINRFNSLPGERDALQAELNDLFHDEYEVVFIPAGRSLISLLSTQLNFFFRNYERRAKAVFGLLHSEIY